LSEKKQSLPNQKFYFYTLIEIITYNTNIIERKTYLTQTVSMMKYSYNQLIKQINSHSMIAVKRIVHSLVTNRVIITNICQQIQKVTTVQYFIQISKRQEGTDHNFHMSRSQILRTVRLKSQSSQLYPQRILRKPISHQNFQGLTQNLKKSRMAKMFP